MTSRKAARCPEPSRRFVVASVLAFSLAACGGGSGAPRDSYYRVGEISVPSGALSAPVPGTIDVPPFRASGIVNE
ncbi:MAG: hypothetical protein RLN70_08365, partial [Rhodospirillaceae bacterium]